MIDDYKWVGTLGRPNQFRGVLYTESTGQDRYVRCLMCGTGWMNRGARASHFNSDNHGARYRRIQRLEQEILRREEMRQLDIRVKQLGLETWQNHVKRAMYDYLQDSATSHPLDLLKRYERKEILSLLELALWKTSALCGELFGDMQEIREYPILDGEFDVRRYLGEARILSGSSGIIPRVVDFL